MLCIRKRETISYLQFANVLDIVHQKKWNCIIHTVCLWSRLCVIHQKGGNSIIHTLCLWSRLCLSERMELIIPTICLWSIMCIMFRILKQKARVIVFILESEKWIKFYPIWSYLHYLCSWHFILSEKGEGVFKPHN